VRGCVCVYVRVCVFVRVCVCVFDLQQLTIFCRYSQNISSLINFLSKTTAELTFENDVFQEIMISDNTQIRSKVLLICVLKMNSKVLLIC